MIDSKIFIGKQRAAGVLLLLTLILIVVLCFIFRNLQPRLSKTCLVLPAFARHLVKQHQKVLLLLLNVLSLFLRGTKLLL